MFKPGHPGRQAGGDGFHQRRDAAGHAHPRRLLREAVRQVLRAPRLVLNDEAASLGRLGEHQHGRPHGPGDARPEAGPDPGGAEVIDAGLGPMAQYPPADARAGFQHHHLGAAPGHGPLQRAAGEAGTDDDQIGHPASAEMAGLAVEQRAALAFQRQAAPGRAFITAPFAHRAPAPPR